MRLLVNIDVSAIEPAVTFYRAALGLDLKRMISSDVAELAGAGTTIDLLCNEAGSATSDSSSQQRNYARHWTPVHLGFVVDDVTAAADRAVQAGAKQESDGRCWNGSRCITFSDPFGHGFCVIAFDNNSGYLGNDP